MRKKIMVEFEYFDFSKSNIKHLCVNKEDNIWYEGMFYGFEKRNKNIWKAKIRVNSNISLLRQMRAFIHECIHCMLDFFWVFAFKLDFGRCDIERHHTICYVIDKIVFNVLKEFFNKELKLYAKTKNGKKLY